MVKHSRNATDRPFLSNHEMSKRKWGSVTDRLTGDSQLPFGYCSLSLKPAKDPVCTSQGWIYDKQMILEYLVQQKQDLAEQLIAYEAQERQEGKEEDAEERRKRAIEIQKFEAQELGFKKIESLASASTVAADAAGPAKAEVIEGARQGYLEHDKKEARSKNFWVAEEGHKAKATKIEKPQSYTSCPMSGKKLRLKDLVPIKLSLSSNDGKEGTDMYACAVSKKPIIYQQAMCLKPSGVVIEESTFKTVVQGTMRCPITNKKLGEKDVIKLQRGGSSFCSHSKVSVKKNLGVFGKYNDGSSKGFNIPSMY